MIFAFLTGVMVSALGAIFIHYLNDYYQLFVIAVLLGLTAGATTSLSSDFRIAITYISIIILPLIISLLFIETSFTFILLILLVLFYLSQILMIFNSYMQNKELKELKGQQNLLNNLFSEVPLGIFSYNNDLTVLYANEYLHKLFGYENKALEGMNLHALRDTKMIDIIQNTLTQGPQSNIGEYHAINGNEFWIETTWFPFKDINDNVLGGIGIINDKTQEHLNQKELKSLHSTLHEQVKKNQILLEENKRFIADMVHQIRTPLSVIMTNTSLIEMKTKGKVSSYLTQINSAINMLSNSYEDLSYNITHDTIKYNPTEINLTDFLNERIDFFEIIAEANDKIISTQIQRDIKVYMNDTELERLIDNNLSNAIKHSNDKSTIEIILKKSHAQIILEFTTEGEPIKNRSKLFDKNYTESNDAKRSLGLGLNMVKTICEKNNIKYYVHSKEDTNTFTYKFKGLRKNVYY